MLKRTDILIFVVKVRHGGWKQIKLFVVVVLGRKDMPNEGGAIKLIESNGGKSLERIFSGLVGIIWVHYGTRKGSMHTQTSKVTSRSCLYCVMFYFVLMEACSVYPYCQ